MNTDKLKKIVSMFDIEGGIASVVPLGEGFINDTFIVETQGDGPKYILQRKNHTIFPDVPSMMDNIVAVSEHIKNKVLAAGGDPMREAMTVTFTKDGKSYYKDEQGDFWAVCLFISESVTYDRLTSPELAYKGGVGIGRFQSQLADFNKPLAETIKGFHNIRHRFNQWDEAIKNDAAGRVKDLAQNIEWIESRRESMLNFWSKVEQGEIPTRVTHNDTKISNILFDNKGEVLCVIDLDTVMSSTSLNDFGDAVRTYTNTGAEDDKDLENVSMSIQMFKALTEGYLSERKETLTPSEKEWLVFGANYIVYEQVLRFLMDYINGDTYYRIHYPDHNLVRAKAQYKLLLSIEAQYDEMKKIVTDYCKNNG